MKKFLQVLFVCCIIGPLQSNAQFSRYIIRLKNKTGSSYNIGNPSGFLTQRAISRRNRYSIPLDSTDLPVIPRYLDSIRLSGNVTILNTSKWLNQVCISTTDPNALAKINSFDFVIATAPVAARPAVPMKPVNKQLDPPFMQQPAASSGILNTEDFYSYGASYDQVHLHNGDFLHNYGFRGEGMQMAIMDAGFRNYLNLPTFDSARNNNQVLGTWDFVANESSVNEDYDHGMYCFSTIAANMPGNFMGSAPAASFYLYRTEDIATEYPVEEQNWAAAAERADSLGADIFSVSLGYTTFDNLVFNYTYADMNGNTTIMARAANLAAKKGILVVAAAGNDGGGAWHYVNTLGDADSALTVGAVNTNRQVASFSSYGPNSDGQVKPDVAAVGSNAVIANLSTGQPMYGFGTSYATPIMAGISTCLWQAFPEIKNMDIIDGLRKSGDKATAPDDRSGYGVPDAKKAFVSFIKKLHTQTAGIYNCTAVLDYTIKASEKMSLSIERKLPSDTGYAVIGTQHFTGGFFNRFFSFSDSLAAYTTGVTIQYRLRMDIGTDTSFYVDSVSLSYNANCPALPERKICAGTSTYFSVDPLPAGSTYSWQVNKGNGFINIINDNIYSGAGTSLLILKNLPDSFYGYSYRCVQLNGTNTTFSNPITVKFTSTWTGNASADWEDSNNWSCGSVPGKYTDAYIQNTSGNYPLIQTSATCHALFIVPGVSVTIKTGSRLLITGQ